MNSFKITLCAGLLVSVLFTACNNKPDSGENNTREHKVVTEKSLPENFYKRLEGTIANQPVVMHLQRAGGRLHGLYYYNNQGKWITLSLVSDSSSNNRLYLTEQNATAIYSGTDDVKDPVIILEYEAGTFKGSWANGDRSYAFSLKENYPAGSYSFSAHFVADSIEGFPGQSNTPMARVSEFFPVATSENSDWLNRQFLNLLDADTTMRDIDAAARKQNTSYLESYRKDVREMDPKGEMPAFLNYEKIDEITISYNDNDFVVVSSLSFAYEGGAHGNYATSMQCYDIRNQKVLTVNDVLQIDSAALSPILERNFRSQASLRATDQLSTILFENHIPPTDNFYFTGQGIGFLYNPYELAAYAQGVINIFIPYTELKSYLQPEFAERMHVQ